MSAIPPSVWILPMVSEVFSFRDKSIGNMQREYFLNKMVEIDPITTKPYNEEGWFLYHKHFRNMERGTVVLFQYQGTASRTHIIASACLCRVVLLKPPVEGYELAYVFDVKSIRVFDPVDAEDLCKIWPSPFKGLSRAQKLDETRYPEFEKSLTSVTTPRTGGPSFREAKGGVANETPKSNPC